MVTLLFLLLAAAMLLAWHGRKTGGIVLFAVAAVLALVWFNHHVTDPLQLGL
jgi:UDP-N-acetylmuramyl pentapeptide phosphotransferase/UDP-N-acetylglucosamine-1-phosphate transferase